MDITALLATTDQNNVRWDEDGEFPAQVSTGGIRCGSCKGRHFNVDTVKACYIERDIQQGIYEGEIYAEEGYVRMLENQGSCSGIVNYSDPQGGPCLCC